MTVPGRGSDDATGGARGARTVLLAGLAVLAIGIAVCLLGRLAASSASDDLATANQSLHAQQAATRRAQQCQASLHGAITPVVTAAQTLLGIANDITGHDGQIVTAQHDAQTAGAQGRIGDFNSAVDRLNAAADAANRGADAAKSQSTTLEQQTAALPTDCSGGRRSTA
jgi:hypothetical protein